MHYPFKRKMKQSVETDLVVAAKALLELSPSASTHQEEGFRSLAPDAHGFPLLPTNVSSSASPTLSCSVISSDSSFDGYASEATTNYDSNHSINHNNHHQQEQEHHPFSGALPLALPEDGENLSPLHCFMRRYCVEAFAATQDDLSIPRYGKSHSGRVMVGQVGIRCIHCKHRPANEREERAVCFPSSLKNIYHSIETWQRRHSLVCRDLPMWIKKSMTELMHKSRAGAGGRRQYWEESARRLGMETTSQGVRFVRFPGDCGVQTEKRDDSPALLINDESSLPPRPVVQPKDQELVTGYLYTLLEQMESCQFTERDRSGGRSKVKDCPVGFPGMRCKHCRGNAGFGRYFPTSVSALSSANSDRNIYNHIVKCRQCPADTRESLRRLQKEQSTLKNRRGLRKQFFESVWDRLHGKKEIST